MNCSSRKLLASLPLIAVSTTMQAQTLLHVQPHARLSGQFDRRAMQTLRGTHPDVVTRASVGSRVNASTKLGSMILVLQPSDEQKAALHTLLDAQQDKGSSAYHKWLTPDDFAAQFGIAQSDVTTVTNWLTESGLSVEAVSKSGHFITFSGTAGAVESAFHTEMHHLTLNGEAHISNTTDIAIPAALAQVVRGVKSLNDFHPKSNAAKGFRTIQVQKNANGSFDSVAPQFGGSATGTHYVGAADLATIFNAATLQTSGNTGKGASISILGRSNIQLSDVDTYRALFGLSKNTPNVIVVGSDPGQNGDDIEAYLDVEMAGALATDATVNFITSSSSLVGDGIANSGLYAVDNNIGDIISLSYGGCEYNDGQSDTAFWSNLWEQAAAQGQTPFVSSGDSGAAGCDSSSANYATHGYGVNALTSSGYSVSVGGTMFVDFNPSKYWGASSTIPYSTALSYIPEAALNQGRTTTTLLNAPSTTYVAGSGIFAGGGGISLYSPRPSWQKGSGIPTGSDAIAPTTGTGTTYTSPISGLHRLQPDLSFISANGHDGTLFCAEGSCYQNSTGGYTSLGIVGGTSVAAPAMASAQALINTANGGRQGNANVYYYALADRQFTASQTSCQSLTGSPSAPATTLPANSCYFQDTVSGDNAVPTASSGTASLGFMAQAGYDEATGLGSPNIGNLARDWKTVVFNATGTTLSLSPTSGAHGFTQTATVQVTPASGSGTPTGDVSLIATPQTSGYGTPITLTLSAGSATANINGLPAGTYSVYAHYAGDTTFASSDSLPVTVNITKEASSTTITPYLVTAAGSLTNSSSFTYGSGEIYLDTQIVPSSGYGTASGSVTYAITQNGNTLPSLTTKLDTNSNTYLLAGPSFANFYLVANYGTLSPGTYSVTASYAGDASFNSSSSTSTFTVNKVSPTVTYNTSTAQIASGATATLNFSIATPTAAAAATGTVTFTDTTTGNSLGSGTLSNGQYVLNTTAITTPGAHVISVAYSGDGNYNPTSGNTVTITVNGQTATTTAVAASGTMTVGATVVLTATVSPAPGGGTVSFYDGSTLLGTSSVSASTGAASLSVANFTAGTHSISAKFSGVPANSSTSKPAYQSSTGQASISIAKSTTATRVGSANYSLYGSAVNLEGAFTRTPSTTAAPAVAPTGVISFYDGSVSGTLLGSATPVFGVGGYATYEATLSVSTLAVGPHNIVASYAGDSNYIGSVSVAKPLTIVQTSVAVPSVTITSGTASTTLSTSIAFNAGSATVPAPTGVVTFTVDNGTTVAATCTVSGNVRNCTASYPAASLSVGTHTITAAQTGDAIYSAISGTGALTVTGGNPSITTTSVIAASANGGYTVTVTITNTGNGPAQAVTLTGVTVGSAAGAPTPQSVGTLAVGASVNVTVQVPASAGTAGSTVVEKVTGTYTGGTFAGSFRVRLPNPVTF